MTDPTQKMTPENLFVHLFCNKMADSAKYLRSMASYYVFDRRPGTLVENFDRDAREWSQYVTMFQV